MHQQSGWTDTTSRLIGAPTSAISTIFTPDALPDTTLPIYPGLGQAPNMLACIPGGLVTKLQKRAINKQSNKTSFTLHWTEWNWMRCIFFRPCPVQFSSVTAVFNVLGSLITKMRLSTVQKRQNILFQLHFVTKCKKQQEMTHNNDSNCRTAGHQSTLPLSRRHIVSHSHSYSDHLP